MDKNKKTIIFGLAFIVISIGAIFLIDYFETQSLLKNGIKEKAVVTGRFYEVNGDGDTSSYRIRLRVVPDTSTIKGSFLNGDEVQAYVKKESFYKYEEGSIVAVVYEKEDLDHAKLTEEIE